MKVTPCRCSLAPIAWACVTALFVACAQAATATRDAPRGADPAAQRIVFPGVGSRGIFDPSVAEDPATGRLWMSFSAMEASTHSRWGIGVRLAYSDDGQEWRDAGELQKSADVQVGPLTTSAPGEARIEANSRGTWQNEASALVYDPNAPLEQRWKVLWHQSLWANNLPRYANYSWIAMKAADAPENLARATAVKLFTGYLAGSEGETGVAPAFAPIAGPSSVKLDKVDPQLGACVFGEPSAISTRDGLYLTLDCRWLGSMPLPHTTLLRCAYPGCVVTDASSWKVIGRLTDPRDGKQIDPRYKGLSGAALVEKGGTYYLLAAPIVASTNNYDGCNAYRFQDLASGTLERSRGKLVATREVHGIPETHHGACAFHPRLRNGILLSQFVSTAAPAVFQIRRSGVELP